MSKQITKNQNDLYVEVKDMIEEAKKSVSQTINAGLTMLYWNIGKRINDEVLQNERAEYGEKIIANLSKQLGQTYGKSYSEKNLRRIMQFSKVFNDSEIVASLMRQLSWTHFTLLLPLKTDLEREFYAQMCRAEKWSVRVLRKKIQSMLFERMAISQKPEELAKLELEALRNHEQIELLQLDTTNIKVGQYITKYLPPDLLKRKLHDFVVASRGEIDGR